MNEEATVSLSVVLPCELLGGFQQCVTSANSSGVLM